MEAIESGAVTSLVASARTEWGS